MTYDIKYQRCLVKSMANSEPWYKKPGDIDHSLLSESKSHILTLTFNSSRHRQLGALLQSLMAFTFLRAFVWATVCTLIVFEGPMTDVQASPMSQEPRYGSISSDSSKTPQYGGPLRCDISELDLIVIDIGCTINATLNTVKSGVSAGTSLLGLDRQLTADDTDSVARFEAFVGSTFTRKFSTLMEHKVANVTNLPWSGHFYPAALDSINHPTRPGQKGPSAKYAEAFGLDVKTVVAKVSAKKGIQYYYDNNFPSCQTNVDCKPDGTVICSRMNDATGTDIAGVCIDYWAGVCHAWSMASILELQPKCAVTVGNVEFSPLDIQALLTHMYDEAAKESVMAGARFDASMDKTRDSYNRPNSPILRDINAGSLLIILINMVGILGKSFVADITVDEAVWNQPVMSYKINVVQPVDEKMLQKLYDSSQYPFNDAAASLMYLEMEVWWVVENKPGHEYHASGARVHDSAKHLQRMIIELDDQDNVIGGENLHEQFDFVWLDRTIYDLDTFVSGGIEYKMVNKILRASQECTSFE